MLAVCVTLALGGCERGLHEMYDQPKYKPQTPTALFNDGNSSRPQVRGTMPRSAGALAGSSSGRNGAVEPTPYAGPAVGVDAQGVGLGRVSQETVPVYSNPLPITPALLERGRERFNIYLRALPQRSRGRRRHDRRVADSRRPPSYHTDGLRNAPDSHFYQVISDGYGVMYPYADRIAPEDRWAIVAYIRALQFSQHAPASMLSQTGLAKFEGSPR